MRIKVRSNTRGYALISVLWMGLGLLLGAAAFLSTSRQEALGTRAEIEAARALELARSGINVALADLGRIDANQPKSRRDGTWVQITMAEGIVRYAISDENGKIDINKAPVELLRPVFERIGSEAGFDAFDAANLSDAIVASRNSSGPKDLNQILGDIGLNSQTITIARRYLTTYNFTAQVNPRTAPPAVLSVIPGIGPSDVSTLMNVRENDLPLPRLGTASVWLVPREGPFFTIEAISELQGGATATMRVRVAQEGLSFRGRKMLYKILETSIEF